MEILKEFVFPIWTGFNKIDLNDDNTKLFEELKYKRVFLYKWVDIAGIFGKWEIINRLVKYPTLFEPKHDFISLNSPDFSMYLDWDFSQKCFIVRSTETQDILYTISQTAIHHENRIKNQEIANRFKWVDNQRFKFVSENGVERIFNLKEDCRVEAYNKVPYFELEEFKLQHFYDERFGLM